MKKCNWILISIIFVLSSCKQNVNTERAENQAFNYVSEKFADIQVLRYKIDGFEKLTPQQKELAYYLYEAGLSGRDIIWDQHYKHNLAIRKTLEAILNHYQGDKNNDNYQKFLVYAKRVFFSNGIHHHYDNYKILPECPRDYFKTLIEACPETALPKDFGDKKAFTDFILNEIYNPKVAPLKINQNIKDDIIATSAVNFYENLTQKEVEAYYEKIIDKKDPRPISYGLNSKLVKENGKIVEKVWKMQGMYSPAIEKIVFWLQKAVNVAENDIQKQALQKLIEYYQTGDLKKFDEYNILWVQDTSSVVDAINGFIEVYNDPLGYRGSFESVVSIKDFEASKRIAAIAKEAQWFEDNSPIMPQHKKKNVTGISAKVITVVGEAGDASPSTPIGINLPNSDWIRKEHGSKSVNLGNIVEAYDQAAAGNGMLEEFCYSKEEIELAKKYANLSDKLHTDMHEVIGHASGQLEPNVDIPAKTLKNYASTLEEARADLVALYYIYDDKLVQIGVMPNKDVGKAEYDKYIRNGLMTQLVRIKLGNNLEEAHMRNRQLVAKWVYEKGKKDNLIEKVKKDGKTYFVIRDYDKLRTLFGELLKEIQRIKSQGDYQAAKELVENYGVKIDQQLHKEVLDRYAKLNIPPYKGFINPKLVPVMEGDKIIDVKIEYPTDFLQQMLDYGKNYGYLPVKN